MPRPIIFALLAIVHLFATEALGQLCAPQFLMQWGGPGTGEGAFNSPYHLVSDDAGYVYVCDSANFRIQKFTSNGGHVLTWGTMGSGPGQFYGVLTIALDDLSNVYVTDYFNARIQKFTSDGGFLAEWGTLGSGPGQFNHPRGIDVDADGIIYVADTDNNRIQRFTGDGAYLGQWFAPRPFHVSVDAGYAYVADFDDSRIRKYTVTGTPGVVFGSPFSGNDQLSGPFTLCARNGRVFVASAYHHRIVVFNEDGSFRARWGQEGTNPGEFNFPRGVDVSSDGHVYVADTFNHRIQKFSPDCAPVVIVPSTWSRIKTRS